MKDAHVFYALVLLLGMALLILHSLRDYNTRCLPVEWMIRKLPEEVALVLTLLLVFTAMFGPAVLFVTVIQYSLLP